ncbi:MAG: thioester reductase domain-containing protein [Cyanobacteria bacterium P01_F01_bin.53]
MTLPAGNTTNSTSKHQPMKDFLGYLKPDVIAEPLINQWYAWSALIPPATASRYLTQSQFKVMQSFIDAPEVHETTLRDPAMMGGPFIQHPASRVDEVHALLEKTKSEQSRLLALSDAIAQLRAQLEAHPPGHSLEPLYAQIPDPLKGYVELVYDAHNSASIRFIEGLLYRSEYYSPDSQSIALRIADCDQRAFVMSTPRLPDEESLFLSIPFADARLDDLFRMRHTPQSVSAIANRLNIPEQSRPFFYSLFTPDAPQTPEPYQASDQEDQDPRQDQAPGQEKGSQEKGLRVRYFGHACVLIETAHISILCDPLVSYEHPSGMARYSYTDLPATIDYALITHNHQDHVMLETLLQLRHKIKHVVVPSSQKGSLLDPSLKLALQQIGFSNILTLDELESIPLTDGENSGQIISIPVLGEHGDLNIATKNAYWITLQGRSILCAADSNNLDPDLYAHIHHLFDDLDVLFLGMECDGAPFTWAYGPLLPNPVPHSQAQARRLDGSNAERASALVQQLNPTEVYIYAMGQEPWLTYITSIDYAPDASPILESNQLMDSCRKAGKVCDRLLGRHQIELSPQSSEFRTAHLIPVKRPSHSSTATATATATKKRINTAPKQPSMDSPTDTLTPFLNHLQSLDIRLWLDGDTLRCNAPKGALAPDLTAQLKENKPAIIALLKGNAVSSQPASSQQQIEPPETSQTTPTQTTPSRTTAGKIDWQQDRHLPSEIHPNFQNSPKSQEEPAHSSAISKRVHQNILLTGATGFLGAFLLQALLTQTETTVYCLIRANTPNDGLAKLKQRLTDYQIWQESFQSRIRPITGDLAQPYLGLSKQQFYTLADQIDAIYHNGAQVHHISPYAQLRDTNVLGTQEIIKLACHGSPKALHYISTLSVLPTNPLPGQTKIYEQADLSQYPAPVGGYNRSKWVAEQLVAQARDRHLATTIYRPGPISGHSQTGVFNPNDFLYRLMQGYVQSGMAPTGQTPLDLLPVDYAANAIVYLSQQPIALGKAFHLIHPHSASSDLLFEACQAAGYPIQRVPYDTWHQKLMHIAQGDKTHPLYPLVALFSSRQNTPDEPDQSIPDIPFDTTQTYTYLQNAPFHLPELNQSLFDTYIKAMLKNKTLSPPPILT